MFLDTHDAANAVASFRAALAADGEWAPAHAGLARALANENPPAAAAAARRALEIDPGLTDAHLFLAGEALDADKTAEALEHLKRALAANPNSTEAHALAAAIAHVDGRAADHDASVAKALAVNPAYGDLYRIVASVAASHYRYDDAVAMARKGVALEPDNPRTQAALGLHLLRVGDERGARRALETAFRADAYDLVTYNLLQMLDSLDGFDAIEAGAAVVKLDPDEAPALRHYAVPMVKDAMAQMTARYGFEPQGPILVESLRQARRLRRPHARPPGPAWRPRRVLRPRGHARFAAREAAGVVQLAGDALARDGPRVHDAVVEVPRAALAHRGHFGLRGRPAAARMGPRLGIGFREGLGGQEDRAAFGTQFRVHAPRHDRVGILPGVAGRVAHRHAAWARRSTACCARTATARTRKPRFARQPAWAWPTCSAISTRCSRNATLPSARRCRHRRVSTFRAAPTSRP